MNFRFFKIVDQYLKKIFCSLFLSILISQNSFAVDSLSYSGRLVKADGAPVAGPVDLIVDLAYTNAPGTILCSQSFNDVVLSNGVFHLKLDLVCPGPPPKTLTEILAAVPPTFAAALRVTDVDNSKVYAFQALHAMPFANLADTSKQLLQLGAANGQVLKWNDTTKKWEPGTPGGGGTVTNVTVTSPLAVLNGATTPALSIAQATATVDGYLSAADWISFNAKIGLAAGGTAAQFYRGDKSWQTLNTDAVPDAGMTNLYFTNARVLGVPLDGFIAGPGAIVATDTVLQAFAKTQGQINSINTNSSAYVTKMGTSTMVAAGTIDAQLGFVLVGAPGSINDATPRGYVNDQDALKVSKAGDTMSGVLTLDSNLKIKSGTTTNYVTIKGHATSDNYNLFLPSTDGNPGEVLQTDGVGNLIWVNPNTLAAGTGTVNSSSITDDSIMNADINSAAAIDQSKIAGLAAALGAKEPTIAAGTAAQYYAGDKTWQTLNTSIVPELTNLYFTEPRVRDALLTGVNTALAGTIAGTDSVLDGFGKTQKQLTDIATGVTVNQWTAAGGNVYRASGNVGIGTTSPSSILTIDTSGSDFTKHYFKNRSSSTGNTWNDIPGIALVKNHSNDSSVNGSTIASEVLGELAFGAVNSDLNEFNVAGISSIQVGTPTSGAPNGATLNFKTADGLGGALTTKMILTNLGNVGIGTSAPTAILHLKAGAAAVNKAPLKLTSGVNLTTPEAGAIEYDGTNLYYTDNTNTRKTLGVTGAGITTLGGLSGTSQTFATGTAGTAPAFSSATTIHTLNIPMAATAAVTAGLISKAEYDAFSAKQAAFTTSAALSGILTDETGSGSAAFSASPTFTGVPLAPTAAVDTNTTQIATTAFVLNQASALAPLMNGAAAVGTSLRYTRADHVHPIDTSRAPATGSTSITTLGTVTTGTWNGAVVGVPYGGTGKATLGLNKLLFGNDAGAVNELALPALNTPSVLLSSIGGAPEWTTSTTGNILKGSVTGVAFGPLAASDLPAGTLSGSGTAGYIPYYSAATTLANSPMTVSGSNVGVGTSAPTTLLDVKGSLKSEVAGTNNVLFFKFDPSSATPGMTIGPPISPASIPSANYLTVGSKDINGVLRATGPGSTRAIYIPMSSQSTSADYGVDIDITANNFSTPFGVRAVVASAPSAANPAYGFYSSVTNTTGAAYAFYANQGISYFGGNVGIGTTTPTYLMDLYATSPTMRIRSISNDAVGATLKLTEDLMENGGFLRYQSTTNTLDLGMLNAAAEVSSISIARATGNVGIGTTAPSDLLTLNNGNLGLRTDGGVGNNTRAKIIPLYDAGGSNYGGALAFQTTSNLNVSTEAMRITKEGNIGIGTSTPNSVLTVDGGAGVLSLKPGATADHAYMQLFARSASPTVRSGYIGFPNAGSNLLNISNEISGGHIGLLTSGAGNVGVGTSTPAVKLDVLGAAKVGTGANARAGDYLSLTTSSGATKRSGIQFYQNATGLFELGIDPASNNSNTFFIHDSIGNATRFAIAPTGNVGIGTINPLTKLHVAGGAIRTDNSYGDCVGGWNCEIYTWDMSVASIYYTGLTQRSDRRLKTNITDLSEDKIIDRMGRLQPVTYEWKNPKFGRGTKFGFIAQDVEKVWPEIVSTATDTQKTKSVDYTQLISPLVKTVQKIFREIASIRVSDSDKEERIKTLEAENVAKAQEIAALKNYLCSKDSSADFCPKKQKNK